MTNGSARMDKKKKVMIIEDETLSAMVLEEYVVDKGFVSAGIYATGEDAVRMAKSEEPDLIFMDIRLPGKMDGMEAARLINADRRIPIVVMSGYSKDVLRERASDYSPAAFLSKPIELSEIDGILRSIV